MAKDNKKTSVNQPVASQPPANQPSETVNEVMDKISSEPEKERPEGDWIKMTLEEVAAYQKAGRLVGWDPKKKEGLLKV